MKRLLGEVLPKWQKLGLINDIIITQSNLKDALQIQQMRQLVDQGVDAIIICCSNPTALNQTIKYAFDKGVPTFSFTGYVTSEYAMNSSVNYHQAGYEVGRWIAEEVGEEGNVLVIEGIPGTSASDSQNTGVLDGLSKSPDVKLVGNIAHMWTSQVGQAETQKWLATHPQQLDGIAVQSSGETGVLQALLQSGRDIPPISIGGELGALCYWRKNPEYISAAIQTWPPGDDIELGWNIMMRTMQGQGPKIQSILVPTVVTKYEEVEVLLDENCDRNSTEWLNVGIDVWGGTDYLDQFLTSAFGDDALNVIVDSAFHDGITVFDFDLVTASVRCGVDDCRHFSVVLCKQGAKTRALTGNVNALIFLLWAIGLSRNQALPLFCRRS